MARSDSVRIPGLGDVHGMLAAWNQNVTEIGAANGATAEDWRAAVSDAAGKLVVLVSPTGLPADMAAQQRTQAIAAARHANVPVAELLADGSVSRSLSQQYGFPLVAERLGSGSDLVLLPMNCLMGGPRGLLCVGKESCVDTVAGAAASLSAEMDSAAMAANILTLQLANLDEELDRGVAGALSLNPEGLRSRCQRMAIQLSGVGAVAAATVVDSQHPPPTRGPIACPIPIPAGDLGRPRPLSPATANGRRGVSPLKSTGARRRSTCDSCTGPRSSDRQDHPPISE